MQRNVLQPEDKKIETVKVTTAKVSCDGGNGPEGHPLVYLTIKEKDIFCPYCNKHFELVSRKDN